jgi:acyl-coenzyme A thioesterase PaaI-like protein
MSPNPIVARLNAGVPFARFVGVEVLNLSADGAKAGLPDRPELLNHIASQHAGALFTVAEAASGAAMVGALGDLTSQATPLVRSATISYLKVARGAIHAKASLAEPATDIRARFIEHGKTDFNINVVLTDADNIEVATFRAEWNLRASAKRA